MFLSFMTNMISFVAEPNTPSPFPTQGGGAKNPSNYTDHNGSSLLRFFLLGHSTCLKRFAVKTKKRSNMQSCGNREREKKNV